MEAFDVLGDPVRRRILELLADDELPSGRITEVIGAEFGIGQPAVSMQLRVLRESGFADVRAEGPRRLYAINAGPMSEVDAWLGQFRVFWEQHLDALGTEIARGRKQGRGVSPMTFVDDFDGPELDTNVWLPHYLPMWSSREETRPSYRLDDSCLVLDIPTAQGLWLPATHSPPLRLSGVQSGNRSGPVGSTDGQQAVFEGQLVTEEQPTFEGHLQSGGHLEIRCRMRLSPRSMAALWMCGFEDQPERCGEICVTEVFGKDVVPGESAEVGVGLKQIRDPHLAQDFAAPRLPIDVADFHDYAVDWDADEAVFSVDGEEVRRCPDPPSYPLQLMVAVFDFPEWSTGDDDDLVPEFVVERISGRSPAGR